METGTDSVDMILDVSKGDETSIYARRDIISNICKRLKIVAVDVEKVLRAKELLSSLQRRKAFIDLIGLDDEGSIHQNAEDMQRLTSKHSIRMMSQLPSAMESTTTEDQSFEDMGEDICQMPFDEERWGNYFTGYQILSLPEEPSCNENSKCIELSGCQCNDDMYMFLHSGTRCFLIDLFRGSLRDNQDLIVHLREAEIAVSKEFGFPVASTIIAKLSPRYQFTGYLLEPDAEFIELKKGYKVSLTSDRNYSMRCTSRIIYVNARFLFCDVNQFDIILIGEDIQLMVRSVRQDHINCCVCRPGQLTSFMPVLFPSRCSRYRLSYEEVEDLTFVREVGINVVISYLSGNALYLKNLETVMTSLQCSHIRLYARVVLNDILGCKGEMNWVAKRYDGLLVELAEPAIVPDIMRLCPNAECLLQLAYAAKKPIIFDARLINEQRLRVDPAHYYYTFFYPDKYLVKGHQTKQFFYFSFLRSAIFDQILPVALAKMPYCDSSHTGADGLARAVVTASLEVNAKAIVVCGVTTRMVQKIAHFRPSTPIVFVSHMRSAEDYVSIYHNVTMLSFRTTYFISHRRNAFRKAVFAVAYLASRKLINHGDQIILVYNFASGTTFPEKYLIYKFNQLHFVQHLSETLFPKDKGCVYCGDIEGIYMYTH